MARRQTGRRHFRQRGSAMGAQPHRLDEAACRVELAADGCLAIQVPDNFDEPSHVLMREVAARAPFQEKLRNASAARESIGDFCGLLRGFGARFALRSTSGARPTFTRSPGPDAIVEWVEEHGTAPVPGAARPTRRGRRFSIAIARRSPAAYPPLADGRVLLPFPAPFRRRWRRVVNVLLTRAGAKSGLRFARDRP